MKFRDNIGIIGDTHEPFCRPDYLNFCIEIFDRCKCKTIVHIGDLVDNHSIGYFEHNPDGRSPLDEMSEADKHLKRWFDAFPVVYLCLGNHDRMVVRKGVTNGLPNRVIKPFREIWRLPAGWVEDYSWEFYGVRFTHGTGFSGQNAHIKAAEAHRQSTVIGHTHSTAATNYLVSENDRIFAMNVGCGIDRKTYAFDYGRDLPKKPVLACGVVTDKGRYCQVFPMSI
jgi:predicted phosphodiesterase